MAEVDESTVYAVGNRVYRYGPDHSGLRSHHDANKFDNALCTLSATTQGTTTTISYTVPEDDYVVLNVFIRGGLLYDRPVDECQKAGEYTIEIETPAEEPELFVSIETGDYRQWKKLQRPNK